MPRDHARLDITIWDDPDWLDLSAEAQRLYALLLSQKDLTYCGLLPMRLRRWASKCRNTTVDNITAALAELHNTRFVLADHDTEEVLVRSLVRNDGIWKQPNTLAGALRLAFDISSPILRAALAEEFRRLPARCGTAPQMAAAALLAGAHEIPPAVQAASGTGRRRGATAPAPVDRAAPAEPEPVGRSAPEPAAAPAVVEPVEPVEEGSSTPSAIPSALGLGEGDRGQGCVVSLTSEDGEVGVPAPTPARVGAPPRPREAAPTTPAGRAVTAAELEYGSARHTRRVEAERLVTTHCPAQPQRVLDRLRGEVIGLLRDEIRPAIIAAGLRTWASKTLPVTFLPELVGEQMRAGATPADAQTRRRELAMARNFELMRADAIAEDDTTPIGLAVRGELPAHTDAAALQTILDRALDESAELLAVAS